MHVGDLGADGEVLSMAAQPAHLDPGQGGGGVHDPLSDPRLRVQEVEGDTTPPAGGGG